MAELDGVWDVKRTGGALPPMLGVRKQISGASGETKLGPLPGASFDVVGLSLRYRAPFAGFVDVLERDEEGYRGRATFCGREFGDFELERIKTGGEMASEQLKEQLVKHIDEAYAMEQNVLRMLDGMIGTTEDSEIKNELREHKLETERHAERMQQRLEAHSATPSMVREAGGIAGALLKSVLDLTRGEKAGRRTSSPPRPLREFPPRAASRQPDANSSRRGGAGAVNSASGPSRSPRRPSRSAPAAVRNFAAAFVSYAVGRSK